MDVQELWRKTCELLREEMLPIAYDLWVGTQLRPMKLEGDTLVLHIKMESIKTVFTAHYLPLVRTCASAVANQELNVCLLSDEDLDATERGASPAGEKEAQSVPSMDDRAQLDAMEEAFWHQDPAPETVGKDVQELWSKTCLLLSGKLTSVCYNTWISSNLRPVKLVDNTLVLRIKMENVKAMIHQRYLPLISACAADVAGHELNVRVLTLEEMKDSEHETRKGANTADKNAQGTKP